MRSSPCCDKSLEHFEWFRDHCSSGIKGSRTWISTGPTKPVTPTPEFPVQRFDDKLKGKLGVLESLLQLVSRGLREFRLSCILSTTIHYKAIIAASLESSSGCFHRKERGMGVVYSPMEWTMTVRSRGRTSNSIKTICCQVPNINFFLSKGTDRSGPISEALM